MKRERGIARCGLACCLLYGIGWKNLGTVLGMGKEDEARKLGERII